MYVCARLCVHVCVHKHLNYQFREWVSEDLQKFRSVVFTAELQNVV